MITPKTKTRITLDFTFEVKGERRKSYEKLAQIICSSHWGSGIDIFGIINKNLRLLFELIEKGAIVIDECEYEIPESHADNEASRHLTSMLGKRRGHPVIRDMAVLFADEQFETSGHYRNAIYLPNIKAYARADGMKPEDIAPMLSSIECEKIILFPYFSLDGKSAYYELTLNVDKDSFVEFMNRVHQDRADKMYEAIMQADERSKAGYKVTLRNERKSDRKIVEQITYRAFLNAPPTGDDDGNEALLARKLRSRDSFVPELNYVAELDGSVIGNIMYTRSKVVNDDGGEWETLTFGPISVLPKYQRQGVGGALIRKTLDTARELGYRAVLIFGYESYYPRFGFRLASEYGITTADGKNFPAFMALPLYEGAFDGVQGRLICDDVYYTLDKDESDKLNAKLAEPMDVDEYLTALHGAAQTSLLLVRMAIQIAVPDAALIIHNKKLAYWKGQSLIQLAAHKNYLDIYLDAEAMEHFSSRLYKYKTSKGVIRFPYKGFGTEQTKLISDITAWRAASAD